MKTIEDLVSEARFHHSLLKNTYPLKYSKTIRVICIHGMFSNKRIFETLEAELQSVCDTVSIDLTDHGSRRGDLMNTGFKTSFYHYVNDVLGAARQGPCIVVGHSIGALAAMAASTVNEPAQDNIKSVISIASAAPQGIPLPKSVRWEMLKTPRYLWAIATGSRFKLIPKHANTFMFNSSQNEVTWRHNYLEDESGKVLRELYFGIPLRSPISSIHMIALEDDRLAPVQMQQKISGYIDTKSLVTVPYTDHMTLDSFGLIKVVRNKVQELLDILT